MWRAHVVALLLTMTGCASLPTDYPRTESHALTDTASTALGRSAAAELALHPGQDMFTPLPGGVSALLTRLYLANEAERSLDLIYYIWRDDLAGRQLG